MNVYKAKTILPNILVLPFVIYILFFDCLSIKGLLQFEENVIREQISLVIFEILVVFSFTTSIIFLLLNCFPKEISILNDSVEMTFFVGNKITIKRKLIKVISCKDYGKNWNAILYVRHRVVTISSSTYPQLKGLVCGNGKRK